MSSVPDDRPAAPFRGPSAPHSHQPDFLSFIRSRLNVIGASVYLLENTLEPVNHVQQRYLEKIKNELEVIRQLINE